MDRRTQIGCAVSGLIGGLLIGVGLLAVARIVAGAVGLLGRRADCVVLQLEPGSAARRVAARDGRRLADAADARADRGAAQAQRPEARAACLHATGRRRHIHDALPDPGAPVGRRRVPSDRSPVSTQTSNDVASTIFYWGVSPGVVECAAMGIAVLLDRSERPLFPRWVGYVDLAVALAYAGGAPAIFVKTGAFGWDGLFSLWLPFAGFSVWLGVTFFSCLKAVDPPAGTVPAPG